MTYLPYVVGVTFTLIMLLLYKTTTKDGFSKLYEGADGRPSTSKFQFFLWTVVVLFAYTALYTIKLLHTQSIDPTKLPDNLLIALGMSIASASVAKAITVSYVNTNRIAKSSDTHGGKFGDLFQDDSGVPDLSKLQIIAWTFIALATFIIAVVHNIHANNSEIPDIDKSLMALMGLGHTAYLAKKAVSSDTPDTQPANPTPTTDGTTMSVTTTKMQETVKTTATSPDAPASAETK